MTAKKLATTLGTGTLGAGGAAGATAWKLGMGSEKSLEPATPYPSQVQEATEGVDQSEHSSASDPRSSTDESSRGRGQYSSTNLPFVGATDYDIKAVNSRDWKTEHKTNNEAVTIKVEEGGDSWQCTIKGVFFGNDQGKRETIKTQVEDFVKKIKDDEEKRKKFVKNCAGARLTNEKGQSGGKVSTIELWVEEESSESPKLKGLDKLLDDNFIGLKRLEEYLTYLKREDDWGVKAEEKGGKIVMELTDEGGDEVFCSIYGELKGTKEFDSTYFKYDDLTNVLNSKYEENKDTYNPELKKKEFLIRNCLENDKKIEGMKIIKNYDGANNWWKIENLEELLLTKIYTNPENQQSQKSTQGSPG